MIADLLDLAFGKIVSHKPDLQKYIDWLYTFSMGTIRPLGQCSCLGHLIGLSVLHCLDHQLFPIKVIDE